MVPDAFLRAKLLAQLSPGGFAMYASGGRWRYYKWLHLLNKKLVALAERKITRLVVTAPPRHGKSEFISKYTPAWYLGKFPNHQVILTSYEASFAAGWGGKARDVLDEHGGAIFDVSVRHDTSARDKWLLKGHEGGMNTAGARGPVTGKGGDLIIVDDPFKNDTEANSETVRENVWEWFKSTLYTRLEPGGVMVVLQTRWHEDDLAGRLLRGENGEKWEHLDLPAIAEEDDALGREPGEPLCPQRYDVEALERIKTAVGEYWWNALYRQNPHSKGGSVFKDHWFGQRFYRDGLYYRSADGARRWKVAACRHFWTVDTASTLKKTSDFTAIGMWAGTQKHDLLGLRMVHGKWEEPDIAPLLLKLYNEAEKKPKFIGIEDLGIYQAAKRLGLPVRKLDPDTDKLTRSLTFAAMAQSDDTYWSRDQDWSAMVDELTKFPRGKHDDRVDACSYAGLVMVELGAERGLSIVSEARS